jgi:dTDP-4-amino-4,6-dideoxygalactose transaminase
MIPFVDLKAQYRSIQSEIDRAIQNVLDSAQFILGEEVAALESEFATYCGCRFGAGVNTGTSALHLALLAAGVKPGDEVVTVPHTFVATVAAICYTGARTAFVDVNRDTYTIDVGKIERAITPRTKVILPVHLYGQPADMDPILEIARKHRLVVIEDACQAHGAEYKGRRVGSIGDIGCFSFYPGKNLGAYGEGGMVVSNNPDYIKTVRILRDWGQEQKYHHVLKGYNYRLEGIQGAILRVKLRHLDAWTEARRRQAALYDKLLASADVGLPKAAPYSKHVYHIYAIRVAGREMFQDKLKALGVQTAIHYPIPVHEQQGYADLGYSAGEFPCAERAAREVLSLPMFAELTDEQVRFVSDKVHEVARVRN